MTMAFRFEPGGYTPSPNVTFEGGGVTSTDMLAQYEAQYNARFGASVSPTEPVPMVYMGSQKTPEVIGSTPASLGADETAGTVNTFNKERTIDSLIRQFERMDRDDQRALAFRLVFAGYGPTAKAEDAAEVAYNMTLQDVTLAYAALLDDAAGRYSVGQKVTPDQILAREIAYRIPGKVDWNGDFDTLEAALTEAGIDTLDNVGDKVDEDEDLSGTRTSKSRSVSRDIMDPNDAMALTRGMLQRELGRDPTKAEFEDFIGTLQGAQMANPDIETSKLTTTTDEEGRIIDSRSSSTTRLGIDAAGLADVALREARSNPSWAEWQAVGVYGPALYDTLGATIEGR